MWWSSPLALALALAGCGYTPALAPDGPAAGLRGAIAFEAPETPAEFWLTQRLEDRLGVPRAPRYALSTEVDVEEVDVRVTPEEITVRENYVGLVTYRLTDATTGTALRTGSVRSFTGFSGGSTTVASRVAADAAQERLMIILADRIVADLLATAGDWR